MPRSLRVATRRTQKRRAVHDLLSPLSSLASRLSRFRRGASGCAAVFAPSKEGSLESRRTAPSVEGPLCPPRGRVAVATSVLDSPPSLRKRIVRRSLFRFVQMKGPFISSGLFFVSMAHDSRLVSAAQFALFVTTCLLILYFGRITPGLHLKD